MDSIKKKKNLPLESTKRLKTTQMSLTHVKAPRITLISLTFSVLVLKIILEYKVYFIRSVFYSNRVVDSGAVECISYSGTSARGCKNKTKRN